MHHAGHDIATRCRRAAFAALPTYGHPHPCPARLGHAATVRRLLQLGADASGVGQPLPGPAPKPYCPLSAVVLTSGNERALAAAPTIVKLLLVGACLREIYAAPCGASVAGWLLGQGFVIG